MSLPDRNNPYSFEAFLNLLHDFDFYADDPFLQKTLKYFVGDEFVEMDQKLREFSPKVSFRWRPLTDACGKPNKLPYIEHYNAYNRRIDRIVRPAETLQLEKEIFSEGLFSSKVTAWESLAKRYLLFQLGEFGVMCPITCTEGLVALITQYPEDHTPDVKAILKHCTEGVDGEFGIGSQFMTEIQGGSDIPSNLLEAVPEDDRYRLGIAVGPAELEVEDRHDDYRDGGVHGAQYEHHGEAEQGPDQGQVPLGAEGGTVGGVACEVLHEGDEAGGAVDYQKEHGDDLRNGVQVTEEEYEDGDDTYDECTVGGVIRCPLALLEEVAGAFADHHPVLAHGLGRPWGYEGEAQGRRECRRHYPQQYEGTEEGDPVHYQVIGRQLAHRGAEVELRNNGQVDDQT